MKRLTLLCWLAVFMAVPFGIARRSDIPLPPSLKTTEQAHWQHLSHSLGYAWRSPLGPGLVRWHLSAAQREGYSVLTEDRERLAWAGTSPVAVDAIYQRAWGCHLALKIPDSCSVDVYPDRIEASCNVLAALFGNVVHWVTPGNNHENGWPPCPLL
jgi:hypothetical protein